VHEYDKTLLFLVQEDILEDGKRPSHQSGRINIHRLAPKFLGSMEGCAGMGGGLCYQVPRLYDGFIFVVAGPI
jgi:hypothetical protein